MGSSVLYNLEAAHGLAQCQSLNFHIISRLFTPELLRQTDAFHRINHLQTELSITYLLPLCLSRLPTLAAAELHHAKAKEDYGG
jgi:hypothetical protein